MVIRALPCSGLLVVTRSKSRQALCVPDLRGLERKLCSSVTFLLFGLFLSSSRGDSIAVFSRRLRPLKRLWVSVFFSTSSALETAQLSLPGTADIVICLFLMKPLSSGKPQRKFSSNARSPSFIL